MLSRPAVEESPYDGRAAEIFAELCSDVSKRTDRLFFVLLLLQWIYACDCASLTTSESWNGDVFSINPHLYAAVFLVGAFPLYPCYLIWTRPGRRANSYVIEVRGIIVLSSIVEDTLSLCREKFKALAVDLNDPNAAFVLTLPKNKLQASRSAS